MHIFSHLSFSYKILKREKYIDDSSNNVRLAEIFLSNGIDEWSILECTKLIINLLQTQHVWTTVVH